MHSDEHGICVLPSILVVILSALVCKAAARLQVGKNDGLGLCAPLRQSAEKLHTRTHKQRQCYQKQQVTEDDR